MQLTKYSDIYDFTLVPAIMQNSISSPNKNFAQSSITNAKIADNHKLDKARLRAKPQQGTENNKLQKKVSSDLSQM